MDTKFTGVKDFAQHTQHYLESAHDALIELRIKQMYYANQLRREEPFFEEGDLIYLSTKNLSVLKGRARKLVLKYIGPYKIKEANRKMSNYTLELPPGLNVHPTFHVEVLRTHEPNDDNIFPH